MASDIFLKISTIPGESTDDKHKDWIELESFSVGVSQPMTAVSSSGGARTAERCNHSDFTFVKSVDKATPKLFAACCKGEHIPEATVAIHRNTGEKQKYLEFKMYDVVVSHVSPAASSKGESLPVESGAFNYGKIEWIYTATDHKTGKPQGDVKAGWDLIANKAS